MIQDKEGNQWFKHDKREHRINHGVQEAHALISFQCKDCWMINLEGRLPLPGSDDAFVMMIRQVNLDVMGGRAQSTIEAHAAAVRHLTKNCKLFRMTPPIPPQGSMPMADQVGMAVAVSILFNSLTAIPRLKGESHIHFDSIIQGQVHVGLGILTQGDTRGLIHHNRNGQSHHDLVPNPTKWFNLMMRGAEN